MTLIAYYVDRITTMTHVLLLWWPSIIAYKFWSPVRRTVHQSLGKQFSQMTSVVLVQSKTSSFYACVIATAVASYY